MTVHATLSASGAPSWMRCYGKLAMEKPYPSTSSKFADEGTAAHEVAQMCLEQGQDASAFAGRIIEVARGEGVHRSVRKFTVDEEMVENVQKYVDIVRGLGGDLMVEQQVDFSGWLFDEGFTLPTLDENGEEVGRHRPEAFGTSDAVIVWADQREIAVVDLKYGKGVPVYAEDNEQAMLYALGTLSMLDLVYDVEDDWAVRLMIVQPRIGNTSEHVLTVADLKEFALKAKIAARHAIHQYEGQAEPKLNPGQKQCKFCRAKATCPALAAEVLSTTTTAASDPTDFDDLTVAAGEELAEKGEDQLGAAMGKIDLIEQWCKAVRAEVERRLCAGEPVKGYKLVQGRKGARAWINADQAEEAMKAMRLKTGLLYDRTLISPTAAEKLYKAGDIGPRQWPKVKELFHQKEGGPSVAPESDKRPALSLGVTADEFDVVVEQEGSDLA